MDITIFAVSSFLLAGPISDKQYEMLERFVKQHKGGRINLLINSPGGSVTIGERMLDLLAGTGKPVDCIVIGGAGSMAFTMLLDCTNRYALVTTRYLVHDIRMSYQNITLTEQELEQDLLALRKANRIQRKKYIQKLGKFQEGEWNLPQLLLVYPGFIKPIDELNIVE
jgi:ATP-dependent protease ClpP protease subunit